MSVSCNKKPILNHVTGNEKDEYNVIILGKECDKMNDSIYDEYMRSVLGYQPMNTYDMNYGNWEMPNMTSMNAIQIKEWENYYPDIYRIVYPMIQTACNKNTRPVTRELIDNMTDEIYFALEDREMIENRDKEEIIEDRQIRRNTNLNDLIRILILRELLGQPGFPGARPPRPPMRPPMGPPPRPQPRPGMGMGNFDRTTLGKYDELYE